MTRRQEITVMAVPKRKTSPSRRGMRRSADALKRPSYVEDKDFGEPRRPHHSLRPQDRHVSGPAGAQEEGRGIALGSAMFVLGFPLLLVPFALYNIIAFITPGVGWTTPVTTVHMMSGQDWVLTWEDLLLAFSGAFCWRSRSSTRRAWECGRSSITCWQWRSSLGCWLSFCWCSAPARRRFSC